MKTVQDYLDLGLVFVGDDELLSETNNKDSEGISMSRCWLVHNRYDGFLEVADGFFSGKEWTPSAFAWRNNDGVKPKYKGLIDVCFECGTVSHNESAIDFEWSLDDENYIVKWRPVVLQSDDANKKIQEKFISALRTDSRASNAWGVIRDEFCLPIGVDSPELREAFKSLKEHLENKPPFWNKSIKTLNCPCVAVNIKAIKPAVSTKEDKPMKPVYTAEMHARGELPPVDSKVKVCIEEAGFYVDEQDVKFEGKAVTVKAAFSNTESEKIVAVENEDGNCYCYIIECIKPIIKTVKVNGFDVPAPMSEAPEHRQMVYLASSAHIDFNLDFTWQDDDSSVRWLSRGLIHSTKSAAIAHAKAMLGINPNPTRSGDGYDRNVLGQNNEGDEI